MGYNYISYIKLQVKVVYKGGGGEGILLLYLLILWVLVIILCI